MTDVLAGYTVAITAARRREEFASALQRRGAKVICAPAIQIVPLVDDSELRTATLHCIAEPVDVVVATTGIGFRGWMDAAEAWDLGDALLATLGASTLLARGPKARGAIRATGLHEAWSPESESSLEVLSYLTSQLDLAGRRVAVQLHGESLTDLVEGLRSAGAHVIEVPVYRWIPAEDMTPVQRVVESVVTASVDAVAFTSAPAAASFLHTVDALGVLDPVRMAMRSCVVAACVGPVTAEPLTREGIDSVQPARARLGALVRTIVEQVPARLGRTVQLAGHTVEVRGHAAIVDGVFVPLPAASMTLLRALLARPGHVVSRSDLLKLTGASDEHAVEVTVARLRSALGDPAVVRTVVKRGYRLECEPVPVP